MGWIIMFIAVVVLIFAIIVIFETRGSVGRIEKKLNEMNDILLELQSTKKDNNVR